MTNARSNFFGLRGILRFLALAALSLIALPSFAFYADATHPEGWQKLGGSASYNFSKKVGEAGVYAANDQLHVRTTAAVQAGASKIPAPAALKFSAPGFFAAMKAFTPLSIGMVALPFVIDWAMTKDFHLMPDDAGGGDVWKKRVLVSGGSGFRSAAVTLFNGVVVPQGGLFPTAQAALDDFIVRANTMYPTFQPNSVRFRHWNSGTVASVGWYPWGSLYAAASITLVPFSAPPVYEYQPVSQSEFTQALGGSDMPVALPPATTWDWPVESPRINPDPYPTGQPAPYYIPTGQPYWDPVEQKWKQSVVKVSPAPTPDNPWRVDVQPWEIILPTPAPIGQPGQPGYNPNPAPNPVTNPTTDPLNPGQPAGSPITNITNNNTSTNTVTNPNAPPEGSTSAPKTERQIQLCEAFPNILACEKLGTPPAADPIPKTQVPFEVVPQEFASSSACPSPIDFSAYGASLSFKYDKMCETATSLRALFLAIAGFMAAFIVASGFRVA